MRVKTKQHFKKLLDIIKEDGFLRALDYDYQVTRSKNKILNFLFEGIDYLKSPSWSFYGNDRTEHNSQYYTATYSNSGRLLSLELK